MLDLHSYKLRFEQQKVLLWKRAISQRNKELIWSFQEHLSLIGVTCSRILKYLGKLPRVAGWLGVDFDTVTKKDVERVFLALNQRNDIALSTKVDYAILVKRFYRWLLGNETEFPEQVKWLKTTLKFKNKHIPSQADLITEAEVQKLIDVSDHPRNKAIISLLYGTGCRIGEFGSLQIGDIMFDQYGCVLNVNGKTGPRSSKRGVSHE